MNGNSLQNLKILSKVLKGDKLCCNYNLFVIEPGTLGLTSLYRLLRGDNRQSTVAAIRLLITECIAACQHMKLEEYEYIKDNITAARTGVYNLSLTYNNDVTTKAGIEIAIEEIDRFVGDVDTVVIEETHQIEDIDNSVINPDEI